VEGTEQPHHNDFVYALKDEEGYLQADDEKPEIVEPFDPASIVCQFCGKSLEQVPGFFQAKRLARDPNTSAPSTSVDLRRMRCSDGAGTRRGGPRNSMAPRVAVLVTSRPCPRRALTIGRQRSPTDNHGRCPCSPTWSIRPSGTGRVSFPRLAVRVRFGCLLPTAKLNALSPDDLAVDDQPALTRLAKKLWGPIGRQ
jgi:hypothetical protein